MEHLETPLTVERYDGDALTSLNADIVDVNDEVIAGNIDFDTARCFCRAVNCHREFLATCKMSKHSSALERLQRKIETLEQQRDDLLDACRAAKNKLRAIIPKTPKDSEHRRAALEILYAVIAKAEEEQ